MRRCAPVFVLLREESRIPTAPVKFHCRLSRRRRRATSRMRSYLRLKGVLLRDQKPTMADVLNPAMTVPSTCRYLKMGINDLVVYSMTCKRVLRSVSLSETLHIARSH